MTKIVVWLSCQPDVVVHFDNVVQVVVESGGTLEIVEGFNAEDPERSKRVSRFDSFDSFLVS